MRKSLITAAVLSVCCAAPAAFAAADSDMGTLIINGEIKGTTCHFVANAQSAQIQMHQIGLDVVEKLTKGKAYNGYKNETTTPFTVKCSNLLEVPKLKFRSNEFEGTGVAGVTKNNGTAKGVGYALLINDQRINIDGKTPIALTPNDKGNYTFDIAAQYARAPGDIVSGGTVNSVVTFTVITD
ncbi:fimbrial protein YehD [Pseudescherichia vulneris]|uniref:fimbrial protein YehD n=1 Tax=Pseudescherichia vulneris TaxID=566 RepID=UPI0028D0A8A4|nr:fimbrial protein YehD [Pseudescherichia vulneris]